MAFYLISRFSNIKNELLSVGLFFLILAIGLLYAYLLNECGDVSAYFEYFESTLIQIKSKIPLMIVYGQIILQKSAKEIPIDEYIKRFCGLPIGVAILPRLAAIVCKTTT